MIKHLAYGLRDLEILFLKAKVAFHDECDQKNARNTAAVVLRANLMFVHKNLKRPAIRGNPGDELQRVPRAKPIPL